MVDNAGPYLTRRQRWVMRQLREQPRREESLIKEAKSAVEYRQYKGIAACVGNDIRKLIEVGLVRKQNKKIEAVTEDVQAAHQRERDDRVLWLERSYSSTAPLP
jgi:hypothetical protein